MTTVLWLQVCIPLAVGLLLLSVPKKNIQALRGSALGTFLLLLLLGFLNPTESCLWVTVFKGETVLSPFYFNGHTFSLELSPKNAGLSLSLLLFLSTLTGGHPFHSKEKVKLFTITSLLICGLLQACFMAQEVMVSFFLAMATHFLFWVLMTQMGTGRRSLIALRIFSIFLVVDSIAIGFVLAPESFINYLPYPWALGIGALLASWLRLGIFPFHSVHRWAAQSIGPSAAICFTVCQCLIGIHFLPIQFIEATFHNDTQHFFVWLVLFHLLWLGLLSIGERRPMMLLIHSILALSGLTLTVMPNAFNAHTLWGPWPWVMGLIATFGLFADELHNLKNDTLAPFEHAQVGLLKRWPQLHFFAQLLIYTFSIMLIVFPVWIVFMSKNNIFEHPDMQPVPPKILIFLFVSFSFSILSLYTAYFQLWRRLNTVAPVERIVVPEGAQTPIMWQWYLCGLWSAFMLFTGFYLF